MVIKLLVSLTVLQALCCTDLCGSNDSKTTGALTEALWEAIKKYKAPEFDQTPVNPVDVVKPFFDSAKSEIKHSYLDDDAPPTQPIVSDDIYWPEGIFGVPQSQEVSEALLDQITKLLKLGADPHRTDNGLSMLQIAILKGDLKLIEILLAYRADPYEENSFYHSYDGMHPLAMAINLKSENRLQIITALVKNGVLMGVRIPAGKNMKNIDIPETSLTPIKYALLNDDIAVVEHLASLKAYVHLHDLLNWAAREGHVKVIEILNDWIKKMHIGQKISKNYQLNVDGSSNKYRSSEVALCTAAYAGQVGATRALLAFHDIDVNVCPGNKPALHCAVASGHAEVVRELIKDPRIKVNADDAYSHKAIYWAIMPTVFADCLRELLSNPDIDVNAQISHSNNETALYTAVINNKVEATRILLQDSRLNVNMIIDKDKTIVGLLAGNCNIVGLLAGNCNVVNFEDDESFRLLCNDRRTIINPEDCVCALASPCCSSGMCDKHQFLKKARSRKIKREQDGCTCC